MIWSFQNYDTFKWQTSGLLLRPNLTHSLPWIKETRCCITWPWYSDIYTPIVTSHGSNVRSSPLSPSDMQHHGCNFPHVKIEIIFINEWGSQFNFKNSKRYTYYESMNVHHKVFPLWQWLPSSEQRQILSHVKRENNKISCANNSIFHINFFVFFTANQMLPIHVSLLTIKLIHIHVGVIIPITLDFLPFQTSTKYINQQSLREVIAFSWSSSESCLFSWQWLLVCLCASWSAWSSSTQGNVHFHLGEFWDLLL